MTYDGTTRVRPSFTAYWFSKTKKWPNLTRMARETLAQPASSAGIERMFYRAGKMHDDLKKKTSEKTLERNMKAGPGTGSLTLFIYNKYDLSIDLLYPHTHTHTRRARAHSFPTFVCPCCT
jgi:hypothetical protein